jgi:hypothetical protein
VLKRWNPRSSHTNRLTRKALGRPFVPKCAINRATRPRITRREALITAEILSSAPTSSDPAKKAAVIIFAASRRDSMQKQRLRPNESSCARARLRAAQLGLSRCYDQLISCPGVSPERHDTAQNSLCQLGAANAPSLLFARTATSNQLTFTARIYDFPSVVRLRSTLYSPSVESPIRTDPNGLGRPPIDFAFCGEFSKLGGCPFQKQLSRKKFWSYLGESCLREVWQRVAERIE